MASDDIIVSLGRELGVELAVKDGAAGFSVEAEGGEQVSVSIFAMDDGVSVELCADLGEMPSEGAGALMLRMLEANHLFASTGGATLSVDDGRVHLERYVGIAELERGDGAKAAAAFIDAAKMWAGVVAHPGRNPFRM